MSQKRKQNALIITFAVMVILITFILGYGVALITGNGSLNPGKPGTGFSTLESVYNILSENFYYGQDTPEYRSQLIESAIKGMVNAQGDPHTEYMTPQEVADFSGSLESTFVGIGVRYTTLDGNIFVIDVLESSPAEKAGILGGDIIIQVDDTLCKNVDIDTITSMICGQAGTDVRLKIDRNGTVIEKTVTRVQIESTVFSEIRDNVGILNISSFGTGTGGELARHLDKINKAGVNRIIIDLRNNGGGYANTLNIMCRYFMKDGEIIMREEYRDGREILDKVVGSQKYDFEKIVILLNGNSASCSEVFTLALTEHCQAITVGTKSYGKGVAQVSKIFGDGSALKYTDVIWKSDSGKFVQGNGIDPDHEVKLHDALYLSYVTLDDDEVYAFDSVSPRVAEAQLILDFLGYGTDRTDGYFSQKTQTAIEQFQKDNGIKVSGNLDKDTYTRLDSVLVFKWATDKATYDTQMNKALELAKQ